MEQRTVDQLVSLAAHIADMPREEMMQWLDSCRKSVYLKGEYFSTPEHPSSQTGVIAKGLFRFYMLDYRGKEHTVGFGGENMFVSSYGAVFHNQHQVIYIQAIERTETYTCDRLELLRLWKSSDAWKLLVQKITEMDCLSIRKRESDFLMYDAKARYQIFLKDFPQYQNRIKQEHIASYLGILPETLSRIKAH